MTRIRIGVTVAACAAALIGCMPSDGRTGSAAGEVALDSLSAMRTVLLRVQNNYPSKVRVYTVIGGQPHEVATVAIKGTRAVVLDSTLFPSPSVSFEIRPEDGGAAKRVGPFSLDKGETTELVVTPNLDLIRVDIYHSAP